MFLCSCPYKSTWFLDLNITNLNKTYIQVNKPNNQVIFDHTAFLKNKFILEIDEEKTKFD